MGRIIAIALLVLVGGLVLCLLVLTAAIVSPIAALVYLGYRVQRGVQRKVRRSGVKDDGPSALEDVLDEDEAESGMRPPSWLTDGMKAEWRKRKMFAQFYRN